MKKEGSRIHLRYLLQKGNKLSNRPKGFSDVDTIEGFGQSILLHELCQCTPSNKERDLAIFIPL